MVCILQFTPLPDILKKQPQWKLSARKFSLSCPTKWFFSTVKNCSSAMGKLGLCFSGWPDMHMHCPQESCWSVCTGWWLLQIIFKAKDALFIKTKHVFPAVDNRFSTLSDNRFNNYQTRYTLRFLSGNPFQIQRNRDYFKGFQVLKNMEQTRFERNLVDRYERVVEFWMAAERPD